jgi:hypothetical protein
MLCCISKIRAVPNYFYVAVVNIVLLIFQYGCHELLWGTLENNPANIGMLSRHTKNKQ